MSGNNGSTQEEKRYAIPVGTSTLIELSKFMLDKRDSTCNQCRTGFKSIVPKFLNGKVIQIPIVCTCVPYIASEDKDGNSVVVYKGVREKWPGRKRPEQYIQNDLVRKSEFDSAQRNLKAARGQAKAHDGVQDGKYQLGVLSVAERKELGNDLVKSLAPKFDGDRKPAESSEAEKFLNQKVIRKVAMRNSEGNLIVVDNETALNMMKAKRAVPERSGELEEDKPKTKALAKPNKTSAKESAKAAATSSPEAAFKRGRGRPLGSKNKPKA